MTLVVADCCYSSIAWGALLSSWYSMVYKLADLGNWLLPATTADSDTVDDEPLLCLVTKHASLVWP